MLTEGYIYKKKNSQQQKYNYACTGDSNKYSVIIHVRSNSIQHKKYAFLHQEEYWVIPTEVILKNHYKGCWANLEWVNRKKLYDSQSMV